MSSLVRQCGAEAAAPPPATGRMRIGILGCSDIAERRFLPALHRSRQAVLSAVASRDPQRAGRFLSSAGGIACSYEELADGDAADLVYLSFPNDLHEEWTLRCLQGGKHVLCEKPLGLTSRSVGRMVDAARERGLLLAENLMFLRHPQHAIVRDLIASGVIGRVQTLRTSFGFTLAGRSGFRVDPARGGGAFHDLIRYPLGAADMLLAGPLDTARGFARVRNGLTTGVHAWAVTSSGEALDLSVSFDQHYECYYEVIGEKGVIRLDRAFTPPTELRNTVSVAAADGRREVPVPAADQFQLMLDHVIAQAPSAEGREELYRQAVRIARGAELLRASCQEVTVT